MEWERRDDESSKAYEAFKIYLEMPARSLQKVVKKLTKSRQLIQRWATQYDWVERAKAYDNSLVEEVRQEVKQQMSQILLKQFKGNALIQDKALKAFAAKDLSKASYKSLNEIYHTAFNEQLEIAAKLEVETEADRTIEIVYADEEEN